MSSFKIDDILSNKNTKQQDQCPVSSASSSSSSSSSSCSSSSFTPNFPTYPNINNIENQLMSHINATAAFYPSSLYDAMFDMNSANSAQHQQILAAFAQTQLGSELASIVNSGMANFPPILTDKKDNNSASNMVNNKKQANVQSIKTNKTTSKETTGVINQETSDKLKLVNTYAKKIDELNETTLKKAMLERPKSKKSSKKSAKMTGNGSFQSQKQDKDYGRCSCDDLACCKLIKNRI